MFPGLRLEDEALGARVPVESWIWRPGTSEYLGDNGLFLLLFSEACPSHFEALCLLVLFKTTSKPVSPQDSEL